MSTSLAAKLERVVTSLIFDVAERANIHWPASKRTLLTLRDLFYRNIDTLRMIARQNTVEKIRNKNSTLGYLVFLFQTIHKRVW